MIIIRLPFVLALILLLAGLGGCDRQIRFDKLGPGDELIVLTRNSPTTYFFDGDQATGFEFDLISAFAESQGLRLRIKVAFTLEELLQMLESGEGHIAAAGLTLTAERAGLFISSRPYITQKPLVVYKSGRRKPREASDLAGLDIVTLAGSSHIEVLSSLAEQEPGISWREIRAADTLELMQLVSEERADVATIDSIEFRMQQQLYPRVVSAMELEADTGIVWYLSALPGAEAYVDRVNTFFDEVVTNGELQRLKSRHFGNIRRGNRIQSFTFHRKVRTLLPKWQLLIEQVANEYQLDWRLLAAASYQESHWDPKAVSRTGVRGMMMLTLSTARDLGVKNRTDARESLRGGARFLKSLMRRLPADILEPDRTWMALAAYNIGLGHLNDARILAERKGLDSHRWADVRRQMPELQNPDIYPTLRYGFARGKEAVTYVDNIRHYYAALKLKDLPENRIVPPVDSQNLLESVKDQSLPLSL